MPEHDEDSLPRVPLAGLAESAERFLEWCAPLVGAEDTARTEAAVMSLLDSDGPGPQLQAALEAYDAEPGVHSWLDTFWGYEHLGLRDRIAGNTNYFCLLADDPSLGSDEPQLERAAALVAGAVNHKLALDEQRLPRASRHGEPLSMWQHAHLFATTRLPGFAEDTLRAPHTSDEPGPATARHIAVFSRGNVFRLDVFGPDGTPHSVDDLLAGLREIPKSGATAATPDTAVGQLTSRTRSQWAASRQGLLAHSSHNATALDTVERALLCLCLDDPVVAGTAAAACEKLLLGDGGNRWFDKSLSLIVFPDGTAGVNVDRGALDEPTVVRFVDTLLGSSATEHARLAGAVSQGTPPVAPIEFVLDDALRANVRVAGEEFAEHKASIATATLSVDDFGADVAERLGAAPDAFVQLATQLAHRRARGFVGSTATPIPTPRYHHGRTELMRVVTPESVRFVTTMDDPDSGTAARAAAFRAALEAHQQRELDCRTGRAPEQHLAELRRIAQRRGRELGLSMPEVYSSPGWLTMRDDCLTTSTASSEHIRHFGSGPAGKQDIAVGYVLLPRRCDLHLSAPATLSDQLHAFRAELRTTLGELCELLS